MKKREKLFTLFIALTLLAGTTSCKQKEEQRKDKRYEISKIVNLD